MCSLKEIIEAAAAQARSQMDADPDIGIPLDPDVAEHMGAFEEHAVNADDLLAEGDA